MKTSQKQQANGAKSDHESRILVAAGEIFLEKGYEETSTADIARRAKVSKRELYSNFADKRDILTAVITQLQSEIQSQADIQWNSTGDLRRVLLAAATSLLEFIRSDKFGKLFRIVASESFRDPVTAERFYQLGPDRGREQTASFMRRRMKLGELRKRDPLHVADDFLNLVISSREMTAVALGQEAHGRDLKDHVQHAVEIFLQYYGIKKAGLRVSRSHAASRPPAPVRIARAASRPL